MLWKLSIDRQYRLKTYLCALTPIYSKLFSHQSASIRSGDDSIFIISWWSSILSKPSKIAIVKSYFNTFKFIMSHWNLEFIAAYFKCNVQPLWFRWIHSTYICISPTHSHILLCTLWNQIENCRPISIYTPRLIKIRGH